MSVFLKPASLLFREGTVRVELPPGTPFLERLQATTTRRRLEEALARRLGSAVALEFAAGEGDPRSSPGAPEAAPRITAQSAREDRLRRLTEQEPVLAAAVTEWDLELLN